MVGAGGGAHSGALNFSASPTASLHSAREKPHLDAAWRGVDRRPRCVAGRCGARPAWKPRAWAPRGAGSLRPFGAERAPLAPSLPSRLSQAGKLFGGILKSPLLRKHTASLGLRGRQIWFPSDPGHTAANEVGRTRADNKRQLYPAPTLQRFGGFRDRGDTFSYLPPAPPSPPVIPRPSIGFSQSLFSADATMF